MIDWNKHPKAAYADVTFFDEHHCDVGSQLDISRPTQTKTVAESSQKSCLEEGEKWTHTDAFGDPCRILIDEPDSNGRIIIFRQDGWYAPVAASSVKPIKPALTKAEAWDRLTGGEFYCMEYGVNELQGKYEIT